MKGIISFFIFLFFCISDLSARDTDGNFYSTNVQPVAVEWLNEIDRLYKKALFVDAYLKCIESISWLRKNRLSGEGDFLLYMAKIEKSIRLVEESKGKLKQSFQFAKEDNNLLLQFRINTEQIHNYLDEGDGFFAEDKLIENREISRKLQSKQLKWIYSLQKASCLFEQGKTNSFSLIWDYIDELKYYGAIEERLWISIKVQLMIQKGKKEEVRSILKSFLSEYGGKENRILELSLLEQLSLLEKALGNDKAYEELVSQKDKLEQRYWGEGVKFRLLKLMGQFKKDSYNKTINDLSHSNEELKEEVEFRQRELVWGIVVLIFLIFLLLGALIFWKRLKKVNSLLNIQNDALNKSGEEIRLQNDKLNEAYTQIKDQKETLEKQISKLRDARHRIQAQKKSIVQMDSALSKSEKALATNNKELGQQLVYGKVIQKQIFPSFGYIQKVFNQHFLVLENHTDFNTYNFFVSQQGRSQFYFYLEISKSFRKKLLLQIVFQRKCQELISIHHSLTAEQLCDEIMSAVSKEIDSQEFTVSGIKMFEENEKYFRLEQSTHFKNLFIEKRNIINYDNYILIEKGQTIFLTNTSLPKEVESVFYDRIADTLLVEEQPLYLIKEKVLAKSIELKSNGKLQELMVLGIKIS